MSRYLSHLAPDLQRLAADMLAGCEKAGIEVLVTCTYRSNEEQARLYAKGRTEPGNIVTNAKPGQSLHNATDSAGNPAARAFDVVPIRDGKPVWEASDPVWQIVGQIGESVGLEWAGRWTRMREYPHFQKVKP